ncbi:MAG: hypothetical protein OEV66_09540 [Spirochaetia bacterium]|nr:hypothetical protein [Spirochaetia bacterium]
MAFDISSRWKLAIVFLKKYFTWFLAHVKIIASLVIISAILVLTPSVFFHLKNDKSGIEEKINKFISTSGLIISCDGISIAGYGNILLYNVRVSAFNDSTKSKNMLTIPVLIASVDLIKSGFSNSLVIKKIILKDARWTYWAVEKQLNQYISTQITKYLKKNPDFEIQLKSSLITIIFEKQNYDRERWNILINKGFIESRQGKVKLSLQYNDLPWGKGKLVYHPSMCEHCELFHGDYKMDFNNFPVNRVSWFFPDLKLTDGFIDLKGEVSCNHINEKQNDLAIKSSVNFNHISVLDNADHFIFDRDRFRAELEFQENSIETKVDYSGYWNKSAFNGHYVKKSQSIWPETFSFLLDNHSNYSIPLLYGYRLEGLRTIQLDIHEDKENKTFRQMNGKLSINAGKLKDSEKKTILVFPEVILDLENNIFKGNLRANKLQSNVHFTFSGSVNPYKKLINTQIEYNDYKKNDLVEFSDVAFEVNETGKIDSENISWSDVKDYYETLHNEWEKNINSDQFKGWRPSILRERVWFQKYLLRTSLDNDIEIKSWKQNSSEDNGIPVSGNIKYINNFAELSLSGGDQKYYFAIDTGSSYPLIRGEYQLKSSESNDFSRLWLPPGLISSFQQLRIDYRFSTSGEHPADIMQNYNGNGALFFQGAKINTPDKNMAGIWEKLNLDIRNYSGKINVNLSGEKEDASISAWGSFDPKTNAQWEMKSSSYQKR